MATYHRKKEALRAAVYAFVAGSHRIIEEVERLQLATKGGSEPEAVEMRHAMLDADYERLFESHMPIEMFLEILNEEDLYPFGSEWPGEAFAELFPKVIPPKLNLEGVEDAELRIRFKKGFKDILTDFAQGLQSDMRENSTLDHWMVMLLNTAFLASMTVAARSAEKPELYFKAMNEIEDEIEPWSHYPQLVESLEKQLRRETKRKTGLVSNLDEYED